MAMDTSEIDHLLELLEPFGPLTARRMFGGWGIYAGGPIVAIVIDGELLLKTDPATRAVFEQAGCRPFVYRAKGREVPMSYWSVPEAALDSAEAMQPWARLALEAAARAATAKPARGRTRKRGRI
jgi:DNA transformation protein